MEATGLKERVIISSDTAMKSTKIANKKYLLISTTPEVCDSLCWVVFYCTLEKW